MLGGEVMPADACCFSGHRRISNTHIDLLISRTKSEIEGLVDTGVTDFISGGALGFDQLAASLIIELRESGRNIRLVFALSCRNQDLPWNAEQSRKYHSLLHRADEIFYVSEEYHPDCMRKRNFYMVNRSKYCICALLHERSGTAQTVRYAHEKGLIVINVAL